MDKGEVARLYQRLPYALEQEEAFERSHRVLDGRPSGLRIGKRKSLVATGRRLSNLSREGTGCSPPVKKENSLPI